MKIKGYCPWCGHPDPEVGPDAFLRCTNPDCPNPDGVAYVLLDNEIEHIVRFDEGAETFNVKHPLRERIDSELLDCPIHAVVRAQINDGQIYSDHQWHPVGGTWRLRYEQAQQENPEFGGDPFSWEKL